jgi:hypothetical protein
VSARAVHDKRNLVPSSQIGVEDLRLDDEVLMVVPFDPHVQLVMSDVVRAQPCLGLLPNLVRSARNQ